MIHRFDLLMLVFKDLESNIKHLNDEFKLQLTIEDRVEGVSVSTLMSTNQFSVIEVFGNNSKKEMQLDNPRSFDKCYISFVSFYTDFTFHNVPYDQVIVINGDRTDESVISIPRGAYDIETIIAKLNASDAFPIRIGV